MERGMAMAAALAVVAMAIAVEAVERSQFPVDFAWGVATSAYQVEGAAEEGGRGKTIWDEWASLPGKIVDNSTAEVACDHFHRMEEDVALMAGLGVNSYRMSLSWSRIIPDGEGEVNFAAIEHYNRLIDLLLQKGIVPYVTLYHFDLPLALQDKYGGWLSDRLIPIFRRYAEICFSVFGDRVQNWITINEPNAQAFAGYGFIGHFPPGRCTDRSLCSMGNNSVEPYAVVHNLLNAHGAAAHLYKTKFKEAQKGRIGISFFVNWFEPATEAKADLVASQRCIDFETGWMLDPILFGDYPESMRQLVGQRLPKFSASEIGQLKNSVDFVGLNYYYLQWAADAPPPLGDNRNLKTDRCASVTSIAPASPRGSELVSEEPSWGLVKMVNYIQTRYPSLGIYITENGYLETSQVTSVKMALDDKERIQYMSAYLTALAEAIKQGVRVRGYFAWSLLDSFEWNFGFVARYGLVRVDRSSSNLARAPKRSARWLARLLRYNDNIDLPSSDGTPMTSND